MCSTGILITLFYKYGNSGVKVYSRLPKATHGEMKVSAVSALFFFVSTALCPEGTAPCQSYKAIGHAESNTE